jgi:alpha-glucosidase (family GH31 glycosyl hydrolase)
MKRNIQTLAAALFTAAIFSSNASAQSLPTEPIAVKYVGMDDEYLQFEVTLKPTSTSSFFKIHDRVEGELYSQNYTNVNKTLTIKIERNGSQELSFSLSTGRTVFVKNFAANTNLIPSTEVTATATVVVTL